MEYTIEIIGFLIMTLLGVIGYFLGKLHDDVKDNIKQTSINKARIDLLNEKSMGKIDQLTKTTELQITMVTDALKEVKKSIEHMNNNFKVHSAGMADMYKEMMKIK